MNAEFVRERITQLRLQKGVSEYQMSYDLGHSRGYINNISSGKTLPSMTEFFAICGYFQITPVDFFNTSAFNPVLLNDTIENISKLNEEDLKLIELVLPEGYEWEYDDIQNAIIIKSMTGIYDVEIDSNSAPSNVYTLKGVKVGKTTDKNIPKGIYVIDGKKTVLNSEK